MKESEKDKFNLQLQRIKRIHNPLVKKRFELSLKRDELLKKQM